MSLVTFRGDSIKEIKMGLMILPNAHKEHMFSISADRHRQPVAPDVDFNKFAEVDFNYRSRETTTEELAHNFTFASVYEHHTQNGEVLFLLNTRPP